MQRFTASSEAFSRAAAAAEAEERERMQRFVASEAFSRSRGGLDATLRCIPGRLDAAVLRMHRSVDIAKVFALPPVWESLGG